MASKQQFLLLVRHGQSEANALLHEQPDGLYYSRSGSDPDVGLTEQGFLDSKAAAERVLRHCGEEHRVGKIFRTRFRRVIQTADEIAVRLPYEVPQIIDERLNKRAYGDFWNLTRRGVEQLHPEEYRRYRELGDLQYRPPGGGENYPDVFARVDEFIDKEIIPATENIVVVTHSVVMLSFQRRLEGLSDDAVVSRYEEVSLPNGHVAIYVRPGADQAWKPLSALEKPALP